MLTHHFLSLKKYDEERVAGEKRASLAAPRYSTQFNATIVTSIAGEMGNQIGYMTRGLLLKWTLLEDHGVRSQIWLQHQSNRKWVGARASMQRCFNSTRTMDFEKGNTEEFTAKKAKQALLYGAEAYTFTTNLTGFVERIEAGDPLSAANASSFVASGTNAAISLPFLHSTGLSPLPSQLERHYHKVREAFAFDFASSQCCNPGIRPAPDESVFHFRNFRTELRRPSIRRNFPELGPKQVAREVFGHLPRGSKVAVLSRFKDDNVQRHVRAFEERGLRVRVISGNSGEQDFCFLLSAEKEIAGNARSTYFYWAGILGHAKTVRLYTVNTGDQIHPNFIQPEELRVRYNVSNLVTNSTLDTDWHL